LLAGNYCLGEWNFGWLGSHNYRTDWVRKYDFREGNAGINAHTGKILEEWLCAHSGDLPQP
jgi:hypothetical protein